MPRRNYLLIALVVCLGFVAAGLHTSAQEKDRPNLKSATAQSRRDAAQKVYEESWAHHVQAPEDGMANWDDYHAWSVRWMQAERDLSRGKADEIAALEGHLKRMQAKKEMFDKMARDGLCPSYFVSAAEFFRLEAEDLLAAARAGGK